MAGSVSDMVTMFKRALQSTDSSEKTKAAIVSGLRLIIPHLSDMYNRLLAVSAPLSFLVLFCSLFCGAFAIRPLSDELSMKLAPAFAPTLLVGHGFKSSFRPSDAVTLRPRPPVLER